MAEALLNKALVERVIGRTRLQRLIRAGWLKPAQRNGRAVLFDPRDMHRALRLLERRFCPPDQIAVAAVRASEKRNGRGYVKKGRPLKPGLDEIAVDFSEFDLQGQPALQADVKSRLPWPVSARILGPKRLAVEDPLPKNL